MSETRNIGGNPVYPCLTIRDYFAAQAMQALMSAAGNLSLDQLAEDAYDAADAMLAARDK